MVLGDFVMHQRLVGIGEIDRLGFDLLDAAARTDRLVVHLAAVLLLIFLGPDLQHRIDGGAAGAGQIGRAMAPLESSVVASAAVRNAFIVRFMISSFC